ncbi:MAG: hypothetical protein GH143_10730 [Calditrichaeota bacterium]|nr:hypothetical protein [Calditrichota bacterium]
MKLEFPIITTPVKDDFLTKFQQLVDSDFKELILIAPFVDGQLIQNLMLRFPLSERKLTIVTRYGDLYKKQKKNLNIAVKRLTKMARKDPTLSQRVIWYVNKRVHAKVFIVNWESVLFGSQNLTYSALKENYELGAYFEDLAQYKSDLETFVKAVISGSTQTLFPT